MYELRCLFIDCKLREQQETFRDACKAWHIYFIICQTELSLEGMSVFQSCRAEKIMKNHECSANGLHFYYRINFNRMLVLWLFTAHVELWVVHCSSANSFIICGMSGCILESCRVKCEMAEHVLVRAKSVQGNIQNLCGQIPMQIWSHDGAKDNVTSLCLELLLEVVHVLMPTQKVKKSDAALLCHRIKTEGYISPETVNNGLTNAMVQILWMGLDVIWVSRRWVQWRQ